MRRVRDIIVAADRRITEYVKYGTVQFKSDAGDFANFVQVKRAGVRSGPRSTSTVQRASGVDQEAPITLCW